MGCERAGDIGGCLDASSSFYILRMEVLATRNKVAIYQCCHVDLRQGSERVCL